MFKTHFLQMAQYGPAQTNVSSHVRRTVNFALVRILPTLSINLVSQKTSFSCRFIKHKVSFCDSLSIRRTGRDPRCLMLVSLEFIKILLVKCKAKRQRREMQFVVDYELLFTPSLVDQKPLVFLECLLLSQRRKIAKQSSGLSGVTMM